MKTRTQEERVTKSQPGVRLMFRAWLSVAVVLCAVLWRAIPASAAPQGFLPSAAGMQPITTLDNYATTNPTANVVVVSQPMNLSIGLPLRNLDALTNLLEGLYDPTSTNYQQYLTYDQFTTMFCPTPDDYQAVINFVQTYGLTVTGTYSNRMMLDVSGTVDQVQNAFGVTMLVYQHPTQPRAFFAPNIEPTVPQGVPILDITGMNNYGTPVSNILPAPADAVSPNTGSAPDGKSYMGGDFRAAYAPNVTLTGQGQAVGLLQFDGYYPSDIASYMADAGISPVPPLNNVLIDGYSGAAGMNNIEVALDIENAISMAPGLSGVYIYEEDPANINPNHILQAMAQNTSVKQFSSSWGWSGPPTATTDQIFQQMALQGQSFFQASGDSGAYCPGDLANPLDNPYITVVGGTTLATTGPLGSWSSEHVWNWYTQLGAPNYYASGGGISSRYLLPSWQQGIAGAGGVSTTHRNSPDVALVGNAVFAYANNGQAGPLGGTSCAAPLWAGLMALINQQAAANGHPSGGFINPAIYLIGKGANYAANFHDITTGNNNITACPAYSAVSRYDLCTGWGTPKGQILIASLAGPSAPTGLTASVSGGYVVLSWTAPSGATSYTIYRSTTHGGPYSSIGSASTATFTDTGASGAVTYYYVVAAFSSSGIGSAYSSEVNIMSPPAPPTGITAIPGNAQVVLNWTASPGATGYKIYRSTASTGPFTTVLASPTTTTYTDLSTVNGTTYYYELSAVDASGEGIKSTPPVSAKPALPPPAPTGLTSRLSSGNVVLSWTAAARATSYKIYRSTTHGGPYTLTGTASTATFTDTVVSGGLVYYYVVTAVNVGGESPYSSEVNITIPPSPPRGITASAGNARIVLNWTAPQGATSYKIYRSTSSSGPFTTVLASPTTTTYTDLSTVNGTTYYYELSAVDAGGEGAKSTPPISATPEVPPAAPTGLTATAGDGQVTLGWNAVAGATSYNVKRSLTSGGPFGTIHNVTGTTYKDLLPNSGVRNYYVVSAVKVDVEGANSTQASAVPQNLAVSVAIGYSPITGSRALYTLNGVTWLVGTTLPNDNWQCVTYGAPYQTATYVAVANGDNNAAISWDGVNWSLTTLPFAASWQCVAYGNGKFVAIANGGQAAYSTDGIFWTASPGGLPAGSGGWQYLAYGNGKFVAITPYNSIAYSTDGINWTASPGGLPNPTGDSWKGLTYGNGKFVAITAETSYLASSTDGINWTGNPNGPVLNPVGFGWSSLTYGGGKFEAAVLTGNQVAYSADAITWSSTTLPKNDEWFGMAYGSGQFWAIGMDQNPDQYINGVPWYYVNAASSADGITWTEGSNLPLEPQMNFWSIAAMTGPASMALPAVVPAIAPSGTMTNDGSTDYNFSCETSSGYFTVMDASGNMTEYANDQGAHVAGTSASITFWPSDGTGTGNFAGNMTKIDAGYEDYGDINLTGLNVGAFAGTLQTLICGSFNGYQTGNSLTALDVSGFTNLQNLSCGGPIMGSVLLATLNVSGCTSLTNLDCSWNALASLDVSDCTNLTYLDCSQNQLATFAIGNCTNLTYLNCGQNQLTSLGIDNCTKLTQLDCSENSLPSLNVTGYASLISLNCSGQQMTSLDASGCTSLQTLVVENCDLTWLNASGCTNLSYLDCFFNSLGTIDITGCHGITTLNDGYNGTLTIIGP